QAVREQLGIARAARRSAQVEHQQGDRDREHRVAEEDQALELEALDVNAVLGFGGHGARGYSAGSSAASLRASAVSARGGSFDARCGSPAARFRRAASIATRPTPA